MDKQNRYATVNYNILLWAETKYHMVHLDCSQIGWKIGNKCELDWRIGKLEEKKEKKMK